MDRAAHRRVAGAGMSASAYPIPEFSNLTADGFTRGEITGPFMPVNIARAHGIRSFGAVHPSERETFRQALLGAQSSTMAHGTRRATAGDSAGRIAYRRASDIQAKPIN